MKAERRHELKQNTLVRGIGDIPTFTKTYGPRILLGVAVLVLIGMLIRYRMNSAAEHQAEETQYLMHAGEALGKLRNTYYAPASQADVAAKERQGRYNEGMIAAQTAYNLAGEKETQFRAQALIYQGDLSWEMANMPDLPGATSRPSLQPDKPRPELLDNAESAYNKVLQQYPHELMQAIAAHFGLAAVFEDRAATQHEDRTEWEKARAQYQAIVDSDAPSAYTEQARARITMLTQLEQSPQTGILPATQISTTFPSIENSGSTTRISLPTRPSAATLPSTRRAILPPTPATR